MSNKEAIAIVIELINKTQILGAGARQVTATLDLLDALSNLQTNKEITDGKAE